MSRTFLVRLTVLAAIGAGLTGISLLTSCKSSSTSQVGAPGPQVTCANAINPHGPSPTPVPTVIDASCAEIPFSMGDKDKLGSNGQQMADVYGWLSFVSLNWPANSATCAPDPSQSILKDPNHPTWLTYLTDDDVYVQSGSPAPWCGGQGQNHGVQARMMASASHYPKAVQQILAKNPDVGLVLMHDTKSGELVSTLKLLGANAGGSMQEILQATGQPLVDQNGRFARFSIAMNQDEYNYVVQNKLYTLPGQKATPNIDFPMGSAKNQVGAIELKAAWKVLGSNDDPSHFFTQKAIVFNNEQGAPSPGQNPVTVGLVGLHIAHKSWQQSVWTWTTFEQVENDTKSFYNPNCKPTPRNHNCAPNTPTANRNSNELAPNGKPLNDPVQVVADMQPTKSAQALNPVFQKLLQGTPWQYYEEIGTQWSNGAIGPAPQQLGNTVQETFVPYTKDGKPNPMYSCIQCHSFAKAVPGGQRSDMSFLVQAPLLHKK